MIRAYASNAKINFKHWVIYYLFFCVNMYVNEEVNQFIYVDELQVNVLSKFHSTAETLSSVVAWYVGKGCLYRNDTNIFEK